MIAPGLGGTISWLLGVVIIVFLVFLLALLVLLALAAATLGRKSPHYAVNMVREVLDEVDDLIFDLTGDAK